MKFKSISTRILVTVLPVVFLATLSLVAISYVISSRQIQEQSYQRMYAILDGESVRIQHELANDAAIAQSIVNYVGAADTADFTSGKYLQFLRNAIPTNQNTLGGGIWFEPYKMDEGTEYFGPYVYWDGGELVYSDMYSNAEYDYPNTEWYINGKNSQGGGITWTDVYYDPLSGVSMLTGTQPFYDKNGAFLGTATADMDAVDIQRLARDIKVGETGQGFLIGSNGAYLAIDDPGKTPEMMIFDDEDSAYTKLAETLFSSDSGEATLTLGGTARKIFFRTIPDVGWKLGIVIDAAELTRATRQLTMIMLIVTAVTLAFMTFVVIRLARHLRGIIKRVNQFSSRAAQGRLSERLYLDGVHDEFGSIAENLNIMMENMGAMNQTSTELADSSRRLVAQIAHNAGEVSQGSRAIVSTAVSLSEDSETQSGAIDALSESSGSILELTGVNEARAKEAAALATQVLDAAHKGDRQMEEMVRATESIVDSSARISSVIKDIDDIAFQTNILALNAAVEAARAGQHGKGFAVVADEVRNLASKSAEAAKRTSQMVSESADRANMGARIAEETSTSFKEIVASIDKSAAIIGNMSEASADQARAVKQITRQIEKLAEISQKNAASAQQSSASAQQMNALAEMLNTIVSQHSTT